MTVTVDGSVDVFLKSEAGELAGGQLCLKEVLRSIDETLYFGGCVRKRVLTSAMKHMQSRCSNRNFETKTMT